MNKIQQLLLQYILKMFSKKHRLKPLINLQFIVTIGYLSYYNFFY